MAIQNKLDANGAEYTEIWVGAAGAQTRAATFNGSGISGTIVPADPLASTTSAQAPSIIAGNADAATARTGGSVRAPNVVGATTNVAGADLIVAPGLGHGSGTAGTTLLKAADVAASGNNAQSLALVGTLAFGGLTLEAAKTLTTPLAVVSTSATTPKVIGGTAVGSDLTLQSTSGVGDGTDTVLVKVGNNGGTTAATFDSAGMQGAVGATTATTGAFTTATASTSVQTPTEIIGNADAQVTARTGGTARAPDVATGGAGNVAGADLTIRAGKGTGTGTAGKILLQAAPLAGAGDNLQVPATVATISSTGLLMANPISGTPDVVSATSEGVAALTTTLVSAITTNGDSDEDNVTLANGATVGQLKVFVIDIIGNAADSVKITPTTMLGGTKISFGASPLGKGCVFCWTAAGWTVVGSNGGTVS